MTVFRLVLRLVWLLLLLLLLLQLFTIGLTIRLLLSPLNIGHHDACSAVAHLMRSELVQYDRDQNHHKEN